MKRGRGRFRADEGDGGGHEGAGMMRWLLTYADLITLLLAFFVILYAISAINVSKYRLLTRSLASAFHGGSSQLQIGQAPPSQVVRLPVPESGGSAQALQHLYTSILRFIQVNHLQGEVQVHNGSRGVTIIVLQKLLFALGSADIRSSAQPALLAVGRLLNTLPNQVDVRGYTDNEPIHTPEFASNWELSVIRAVNVVHFLIHHAHIAPGRLRATGFGQYHPFYPNSTPQNRAENRRVELLVLR